MLAFVAPSTTKLFVLHLVRGDVPPRNNPVLSGAGNGNTCSSLQSTQYSDVTISKTQEPRCTASAVKLRAEAKQNINESSVIGNPHIRCV